MQRGIRGIDELLFYKSRLVFQSPSGCVGEGAGGIIANLLLSFQPVLILQFRNPRVLVVEAAQDVVARGHGAIDIAQEGFHVCAAWLHQVVVHLLKLIKETSDMKMGFG